MDHSAAPIADHPVNADTEAGAARPWYRRRSAKITMAGLTACTVMVTAAFAIPYAASAAPGDPSASSEAVVGYPGTMGGTSDVAPRSGSGSGSSTYGYSADAYGSSTTVADATEATADESTGVVLIDTVLGYSSSAAAGTGMVLTSDGLVLTNNHVVESSTKITVTIASTGENYTATVVGTDADDDVALLQLEGASGLATVTLDDDDADAVGDEVTAVGNADGGGILMAADGEITELDASVTTAAEGAVDSETLDGTIEIAADVVAGDSGGAVLDAEGEVIGMTTAASNRGGVGYAIDIDDALAIVDQIVAGDESDGVVLGYPAFLGVGIAQTASTTQVVLPGARTRQGAGGSTWSESATADQDGVTISGVYEATPAQQAGLAAGDTITAIDGIAVTGADSLSSILESHNPGDSVTITWTDASGTTQSATVTLMAGPV
ncbi:S1C family serine protease [Microbacterium schleiferi]|uniref:S1C family serine protease n=1 Tax=Microbacterium schleiferi TaxID=69362 RepID=UPI00311D6768